MYDDNLDNNIFDMKYSIWFKHSFNLITIAIWNAYQNWHERELEKNKFIDLVLIFL